jgi:CheY-like chemotaxis protein
VEQAGNAEQLLRFSVVDTGIGIASGRLPHLLEPFEQAHASTSRQYGGTGLGLSVSNRLAALMHGTLRLASEPGRGTQADFTCRFPVHRGQRPAGPEAALQQRGREHEAGHEPEGGQERGQEHQHEHLDGHELQFQRDSAALTSIPLSEAGAPRVLVADDHAINRDLVRRQLAVLGYSCDVVEDAADALEALRARPYALLLTDCQMPPMNGRELARQWRDLERHAQRPARMPVVLMSAALPARGEQEADGDIDARLFKPIKLDDLREALRRYLPGELRASAMPGTGLAWPSLSKQFGSEAAARRFISASAAHLRQDLALARGRSNADSCVQFADWIHRSLGGMAMLGQWPVMDEGAALERALRQSSGPVHPAQIRLFLLHFEEALVDIERHARSA